MLTCKWINPQEYVSSNQISKSWKGFNYQIDAEILYNMTCIFPAIINLVLLISIFRSSLILPSDECHTTFPANTQCNKHLIFTSKYCFDVMITCLLCFVFAGLLMIFHLHQCLWMKMKCQLNPNGQTSMKFVSEYHFSFLKRRHVKMSAKSQTFSSIIYSGDPL